MRVVREIANGNQTHAATVLLAAMRRAVERVSKNRPRLTQNLNPRKRKESRNLNLNYRLNPLNHETRGGWFRMGILVTMQPTITSITNSQESLSRSEKQTRYSTFTLIGSWSRKFPCRKIRQNKRRVPNPGA